jgi:hypothetical protein
LSLPDVELDELVPDEFEPDEPEPAALEPAALEPDELGPDELVPDAAGVLPAPDDSPPEVFLSEDPPFELVLVEGDEGGGAESGSIFPFRA